MTSCGSMIAPCGIDCLQCDIYKAANDPQFAEQCCEKAKAGRFVGQGCRGDRSLCWTEDCKIYACCVEQRGLDSCSACVEFPCEMLQKWATDYPSHAAPFERLEQMRAKGK